MRLVFPALLFSFFFFAAACRATPELPCLTGIDLDVAAASASKPAAWRDAANLGKPPAPVYGPYDVVEGEIPNFMPQYVGPHSASIFYPKSNATEPTFPFLSFAHGAGEGSFLPPGAKTYPELLKLTASWGFVVVLPNSETGMAYNYYHQQLATIETCSANRTLHPGLAAADFSSVGVYGHSMGAMSTLLCAGGLAKINPAAYNITAAVSMHPCGNPFEPQSTKLISVPILFTAGSADVVCEDECAAIDFRPIVKSDHIFFDVEGIGHMDPTYQGSNYEIQTVVYFLTCKMLGQNCDKIYGASGQEVCNQPFKLASCKVVNGTSSWKE